MATKNKFDKDNQPTFRKPRGKAKNGDLLAAIDEWSKGDPQLFYKTILARALKVNDPAGPALLRDILARVMPTKKATMPEFVFKFDANAGPADQIDSIAKAVASGEIPVDAGKMLVEIIRDGMAVREITELADRLAAIEERLGGSE